MTSDTAMRTEREIEPRRAYTRNSNPSIVTSQWVSDLEIAARELHVLRRAMHPNASGDGLCQRLMGYAAIIEATLRPERDD